MGASRRTARDPLRPARICEGLLRALDASEGRRRRRKRNTTPDAIGLGLKRSILEDATREDPDPEEFEAWLVERCESADLPGGDPDMSGPGARGAMHAMARTILEEWSMAVSSEPFREWLVRGAPSDDAGE